MTVNHHATFPPILTQLPEAAQLLAALGDEANFLALYEPLASRLLNSQIDQFAALVGWAQTLSLQTAPAQQWHTFFEAVLLARQDRFPEARSAFTELLSQQNLIPLVAARAHNARAITARVLGDLNAALADYAASLTQIQQLGDQHFEGIVRTNQGVIAYQLQRYDEALQHLALAADCFTRVGDARWLANVRSEQAVVYRDLGQWDAARASIEVFIAQARQQQSDDLVAKGLCNLGEILLFAGDLAGAEESLLIAIDLMQGEIYKIDALLHLGMIYQVTNRMTTAETAFLTAREVAREIGRNEIMPIIHLRLATLWQQQGDITRAIAACTLAAEQIERGDIQDETLKISLLGRWQQIFELLVLLCHECGDVDAAFRWSERARARAFADALGGGDGEIQPAMAQRCLSTDHALLSFFTTGVMERDIPLVRAISADHPLRPLLLPPAHTLRFMLTTDALTLTDCQLDPNQFTTVASRGSDGQRFLHRRILPVLRQRLLPPDAPQRLTIVPHGPLHHIPFAALLPATIIDYTPSVSLCQSVIPRPIGEGRGIAMAYDGDGQRAAKLRFATIEAQMVAQIMDGALATGERATANWLHFACHGWFDYREPMQSYLALQEGSISAEKIRSEWRLSAELVTLSACQTGISQILRGDEPMGLVRAFLHAGAHAVLVTHWAVDDLATLLLMQAFYTHLAAGQSPAQALTHAQRDLRELTSAAAHETLTTLVTNSQQLDELTARHHRDYPFADPRYWAGFALVTATSAMTP